MARPEPAAEPSMDEILASIRKIIAEDPVGSRPKPAISAKTAGPANGGTAASSSGMPAAAAKPTASPRQAMFADPPLSGAPAAGAVRADAPKTDPMAAAMARGVQEPAVKPVATPVAVESALNSAAVVVAEGGPEDSKLYGRLAEALRGGPAAPAGAAPMSDAAAPQSATTAKSASAALADDLDDLLADAPSAAPAMEMMPATAANAASHAMPNPAGPAHEEMAEARAIHRRTLDFGSVVPQRTEAEAAAAAGASESERLPVKPSAHAAAFDKMLSARMSTGKQEPAIAEPAPEGPVVIAAMPDTRDTSSLPAGEGAALEIEDPEAAEAAKSALGALMAGLAASSAAPVVEAAAPASPLPAAPEPQTVTVSSTAASVSSDATAGNATTTPTVAVTPAKSVPQMKPVEAARGKPADTAKAFDGAKDAAAAQSPPAPAAAVSQGAAPSSSASVPALAASASSATAASAAPAVLTLGGVRTVEDIVAELLRPMLREWLAENMPRMVEKALRIELAEGLKTVTQTPRKPSEN